MRRQGRSKRRKAPADIRPELTPRETQVLQLLANGDSVASAADALGISFETCRTHVKNAMRKLNVRTIAHAIALALRRGMID
jgi:DNA-binding NarL/FixJ family response regulator